MEISPGDVMSFFPRDDALNDVMVKECVAEYMMKMEKSHECVRHFAFRASPHTSVAQLQDVCEHMKTVFTVEDATDLCTDLNAVHAKFWARFVE